MKVLIADDEIRQRELVATFLKQHNCFVIEADTGKDAINRALAEKPDLIIMDHHMPEMNGYDAIKEIRKNVVLNKIPFVMCTIDTYIQSAQEDDRFQYCAFLPKPYSTDQLASAISVALRKPFPES